MIRLFLVRHGRTFLPDQEPVFLGRHDDVALTPEGLAQAGPVARALDRAVVKNPTYYVSKMSRTRHFAEAVRNARGETSRPITDAALAELDYGRWRQKSHRTLIADGEQAELAAWNEHSVWPKTANFSESPELLRLRTQAFAAGLLEGVLAAPSRDVVVVGHNGQLRYFLSLIENAEATYFASGKFKLACGHLALLTQIQSGGPWSIAYWNLAPDKAFA